MKKNIIVLGFSILSALILAGCSNIFEPPQISGGSDNLNGTLIVQIGTEERTLVPDESALTGLVYKLTIFGSNNTVFSGEFKPPAAYNLASGNWTITAEAYSGDNLVAAVTKEIAVVAGQVTRANLILLPAYIANAAGTFNYKISYPDSADESNAIGYTNAALRLSPVDQKNSGLILIDLLADHEKNEGTLDLPPGCYLMTINITSTRQIDDNPLSVNRVEVVYIYPNLTTNAVFTFIAADFIAFVRLAGTAVVYKFDGISENTDLIPVLVSVFDDNNMVIKEGEIIQNDGKYEWDLFVPSHHLSRGNLDRVAFSFKSVDKNNPERIITSLMQASEIYYPHGNASISLSMRTKAADIGIELPGTGGNINFSYDVIIDEWLDFEITNPDNYGLIADTLRINSSCVELDNIISENGKIYAGIFPPSGSLMLYADFFHLKGTAVINTDNPFGYAPATIKAFESGTEGDIIIASANFVMNGQNNFEWQIPIPSDYVWRSESRQCRLIVTLQADGQPDVFFEAFANIDELATDADTVPQININNLVEGKLLILQAYGTGGSAQNGVNRSFVELYNATNMAIDLSEYNLYFANGTRGLPKADKDGPWSKIELSGIIPARGSYLILGPDNGGAGTRFNIPAGYGDINSAAFILSNRSFKVALLHGSTELTDEIQNPFDVDGNGTKIDGYVDMIGSANDPGHATNPDQILGFETAPARNSGSEAIRRRNLIDTDDNSIDFITARYATGGLTDAEVETQRPRNSSAGAWDPFEEPVQPEGSEKLMILQANTHGNDNGLPAAPTGGGFARSLVELYNNTDTAIDLAAGNYYLHIGNAIVWTNHIKLEGIIPPKSSFLIMNNNPVDANATPRAILPAADQAANFVLGNSGFKVAVMVNQSALSVANPFTEASLSANYVDMLGTEGTNGFETQSALQTRPQGPRRTSLTDTDDNSADFAQVDFRGGRLSDAELYKVWPRNSAAGPWNPITGLPRLDPAIP